MKVELSVEDLKNLSYAVEVAIKAGDRRFKFERTFIDNCDLVCLRHLFKFINFHKTVGHTPSKKALFQWNAQEVEYDNRLKLLD